MGGLSFFASLLLSILVVYSCYHKVDSADDQLINKNRETLEIIIGGGGVSPPAPSPDYEECPPPPPPPCPPPPSPSPSPPPPSPSPSPPPPPSPSPSPPPPPPPSPSPPPPSPKPSPRPRPPKSPPPPSPPPPSPSPSPPPPPPPSPSPPPPPSPKPSPRPRPPKSPPPPSPPPPSPKPSPRPRPPKSPPPIVGRFESKRLAKAFKVFKNFRGFVDLVNGDPKGFAKSWQGNDVCGYKGVLCDFVPVFKEKTVAGLDINGAALSGHAGRHLPLKGFVDQLSDLVFFHANSNNYTDTAPDTSKLQYFYEFDLSNNKLTGEFPKEVLRAKNLTFLDIRFNRFTGPVPPELFNLDVDVLFINNNQFTQQIPRNLGSSRAHYFTFANNEFTGHIPSSIGQASKTLYEILLLGNKLSGCLPYEIGLLKEATVFDASTNLLTGPIPHSFGCLAKIQFLSLANNRLYGPVPELVCKLSDLAQLSLGNNYFTEIGPECRKLLKNKILDVSKNCILDLPNQKSKAECANFFSKPRKCPNERMMTYIPCKKYLRSDEKKSAYPVPTAPLSYGTLTPHRH